MLHMLFNLIVWTWIYKLIGRNFNCWLAGLQIAYMASFSIKPLEKKYSIIWGGLHFALIIVGYNFGGVTNYDFDVTWKEKKRLLKWKKKIKVYILLVK